MFNELALTWEDVECFIRPQLEMAKRYKSGIENEMLLVTSYYKSNGTDGYFNDDLVNYFDFFEKVISKRFPFSFKPHFFLSSNDAIEFIMSNDFTSPLLVPCNIKNFFYYEGYKSKDWAHYFIINSYDKDNDIFLITDNLHLSPDSRSVEYGRFNIDANLIRDGIGLFLDSHVCGGYLHDETYYRFKKLWVLSMEICTNNSTEDSCCFTSILERFLEVHGSGFSCVSNCQDVNALKRCFESGSVANIRKLLMLSNQRILYGKIVCWALNNLSVSSTNNTNKVRNLLKEKNRIQSLVLIKIQRRESFSDSEIKNTMGQIYTLICKVDCLLKEASILYLNSN